VKGNVKGEDKERRMQRAKGRRKKECREQKVERKKNAESKR
jgi:hypothetical protein